MSLRYTKPEQCLAYEKKLNDPRTPIGAVTVCPKWTCAQSPQVNPENRKYECVCGSGNSSEDEDEKSFNNCMDCLENCPENGEPTKDELTISTQQIWNKIVKKKLVISVICVSILILIIIALIYVIKNRS